MKTHVESRARAYKETVRVAWEVLLKVMPSWSANVSHFWSPENPVGTDPLEPARSDRDLAVASALTPQK